MTTPFIKKEKNGIVLFKIPSFEKTGLVIHTFSGRLGGVSTGVYESLNLSILTSDSLENAWENRRRFFKVLGIEQTNVVGAHQVHQDHIYKVTAADKGCGAYEPATAIQNTDALMTNEPGIALTAFFADCVPVFFLDPVNKAIAITHAGWKGTVAKIAAKTVQALKNEYNTDPARLLAAIGPSIGPCHYQVDRLVIDKVKAAFAVRWDKLLSDLTEDGHGQLNLWEANRVQLEESGIPKENITVSRLCTSCNDSIFFSHRKGMAGRQAGVIMLK